MNLASVHNFFEDQRLRVLILGSVWARGETSPWIYCTSHGETAIEYTWVQTCCPSQQTICIHCKVENFSIFYFPVCTSCSQKADGKAQSLKSEMIFQFCWGVKKVFSNWLLVWMVSTSPCNSLISCSLVWPKSLWQKPVLITHHRHGIASYSLHATSVICRSTLSPWAEQNTDSHSQPNLCVTVCIHVLSFLSFIHGLSIKCRLPANWHKHVTTLHEGPEKVYPGLWFDHGRG
jgi:hypothetical protein